jgi:hypothetical protein
MLVGHHITVTMQPKAEICVSEVLILHFGRNMILVVILLSREQAAQLAHLHSEELVVWVKRGVMEITLVVAITLPFQVAVEQDTWQQMVLRVGVDLVLVDS